MPLISQAVDALGVITICLVVLLVLLGLFCIIYTIYFRVSIHRSAFASLGYFNGPWILRIIFIAFGICWGSGEVVRLSIFRQEGKVFQSLGRKWQEDICKIYILSNLGFSEPCLFLTMGSLLRASLKWKGSGILNQNWNFKTTGYVLLYCLPVFIMDVIFVMVAPKLRHGNFNVLKGLPDYFTSTTFQLKVSGQPVIICTFPLLCTILHGMFVIVLTTYLLLLGRQMLVSVINKGLQKRVYILILLVSSFLPLRVLLLGVSVFARAEHFLFEALGFCGFIVLLCCVVVGFFILVYLPVSDSLALNRGWRLWASETEGGSLYTSIQDYADSVSLVAANQSHVETSTATSLGRNSDASTKRGSISFQTMIKEDASSAGGVYEEEMITLSTGFKLLSASSPGSPVVPQIVLSSS